MKTRPQKKKTLATNLKLKSTSPKHSATPGHIFILPKIKWPREILKRLTNFTFHKIHKQVKTGQFPFHIALYKWMF